MPLGVERVDGGVERRNLDVGQFQIYMQTASADAPWSNEQRHHDDKHSSPYRVRMMKTEGCSFLIFWASVGANSGSGPLEVSGMLPLGRSR